MAATTSAVLVSSGATTPAASSIDINNVEANESSSDPFRYSHGLTGVDQPANYLYVNLLITTVFTIVLLTIAYRILTAIQRDRRQVTAINSPPTFNQDFWAKNRFFWWGDFKRYLVYSPLWRTRHNREFQISNAVGMGTLPSRLQLIIMVVYSVSNLIYCFRIPEPPEHDDFHNKKEIAAFRGRCGSLAAFNIILTILFALRNNPFIWLLHISYDTFNLFHRWTARLVFLESVGHVGAWMLNTYRTSDDGMGKMKSINWVLSQSVSYQWGLSGFIAFSILMIHSLGPLRHAFYETFLTLHRLSIAAALLGVWFHMAKHALPQLPWVYLFLSFLLLEFLGRAFRIIYYNSSWKRRTWTKVTIEALPGEASRVSFELARTWTAKPGSSAHIYLPSIAWFASHPFSIAWSKPREDVQVNDEKLPKTIKDLEIKDGPSTVSCVIRARTGMTRKLYNKVSGSKCGTVQTWGIVEGPYGGYHSLDSYGTVVLFAAGVGITHQISFVRHLLIGHNNRSVAARKVCLVWSVQNPAMFEWIQPWVDEIMALPNYQDVVRIHLYVSRRQPSHDSAALPAGVDVWYERCNPQEVVDREVLAQVGAMAVTVCGPGAFSDSVRAATRRRTGIRSVDFIEEAFSY
ncbi:ferric reductase [Lindgomyces ingoldianus]|uniref:Ferric reductase n=1 Tax=Lindgomyces ingoldianus TaxID=673940 RepID=A0ACB6R1K1_9PLEO|nr:ferric reductase [Lindgomyces ingoldianus]KAF2472965.1 ferric reductase [Lindgomyces ingoldianus]